MVSVNKLYLLIVVCSPLAYYFIIIIIIIISPVKYVVYFYISTFRSMCAVPSMAVFCSTLISCFPGMLLRYCRSDFEMVPIAPLITGINFAYAFHMH